MEQTYFWSSTPFLRISIFADPNEDLQQKDTLDHSNSVNLWRMFLREIILPDPRYQGA